MTPCPNCRDRIDELEEEVRQLRAAAHGHAYSPPPAWRLSFTETVVMRLLLARERVTFPAFVAAMTETRWDYHPEPKILDVYICKLRKKLGPFGVEIATIWGQGWALEEPFRSAVKAAMTGGDPTLGAPVVRPVQGDVTAKILSVLAEHPEGMTIAQCCRAIPHHGGVSALLGALAERGDISRWRPAGLKRGFIYTALPETQRRAS